MISYYELLGMIKEDKAPRKIRVHLTSEPREYRMIFDCGECNYYELIGNENDDYKYYLSDSYLESMMFDKNIEILDKKEIKKIEFDTKDIDERIVWFDERGKHHFNTNVKDRFFANKINEIIDIIKELREGK